jgi:hypothetical protein
MRALRLLRGPIEQFDSVETPCETCVDVQTTCGRASTAGPAATQIPRGKAVSTSVRTDRLDMIVTVTSSA